MGYHQKYLTEVPRNRAYELMNWYDWQAIKRADALYQKLYNEYPFIRFYRHRDNAGLVAVYEYGGREVLTLQVMADLVPLWSYYDGSDS